MLLREIYNEYGFQILFGIAVTVLIIIFIWNRFSGANGSYVNHSNTMWKLFNIPVGKSYNNDNDDDDDEINENVAIGDIKRPRFPSESKGELECRRSIELLTGKLFPKARPDFMKNDITKSNLELDCYNDAMKIAVEYNGEQHYKYNPYFHKSKEAFHNGKYRDDIKRRLCQENGIKLIIVPYTVPLESIEKYIKQRLLDIRSSPIPSSS